jgi:hypothetical protein
MPKKGDKLPMVGKRWSLALRQRFPRNGAKLLVARYGVSLKTANSWLNGQTPRLEHFLVVSDDLGPTFVAEVIGSSARWASYLSFQGSLEAASVAVMRMSASLVELSRLQRSAGSRAR